MDVEFKISITELHKIFFYKNSLLAEFNLEFFIIFQRSKEKSHKLLLKVSEILNSQQLTRKVKKLLAFYGVICC